MDLVLIGIQGSGKGTQARLVAEKYNMVIFETGDVLRKMSTDKSALGEKINSIISRGKLVPPGVIINILNDFLDKNANKNGIIFDGIPRSLIQKKLFDRIMKERNREFMVVKLKVDKAKTYDRILKRALIEHRVDDKEEVIKNRFENFQRHTMPVIEAYEKENKLIVVNGDQPVEKVNIETEAKLHNLLEKSIHENNYQDKSGT